MSIASISPTDPIRPTPGRTTARHPKDDRPISDDEMVAAYEARRVALRTTGSISIPLGQLPSDIRAEADAASLRIWSARETLLAGLRQRRGVWRFGETTLHLNHRDDAILFDGPEHWPSADSLRREHERAVAKAFDANRERFGAAR